MSWSFGVPPGPVSGIEEAIESARDVNDARLAGLGWDLEEAEKLQVEAATAAAISVVNSGAFPEGQFVSVNLAGHFAGGTSMNTLSVVVSSIPPPMGRPEATATPG